MGNNLCVVAIVGIAYTTTMFAMVSMVETRCFLCQDTRIGRTACRINLQGAIIALQCDSSTVPWCWQAAYLAPLTTMNYELSRANGTNLPTNQDI